MSIPLSNLDSVLTSTDKAKGLPNEHYRLRGSRAVSDGDAFWT